MNNGFERLRGHDLFRTKKAGQQSVDALKLALTKNACVERPMALIPDTSVFRPAQVIAVGGVL